MKSTVTIPSSKSHGIKNSNKVWALVWVFLSAVFVSVQIIIGTNISIILMAVIALFCSGMPFIVYGIYDLIALFAFSLLAKYSLFPFFLKTIVGERIDIGLQSPNPTFFVIMVGSILICIALFFVNSLPLKGHTLFSGELLPFSQRRTIGYYAIFIGMLFLFLHIQFQPKILPGGQLSEGFGGFGQFINILDFGVISLTSVVLQSKNLKERGLITAVFAFVIFFSLLANAKRYLILSILSFVLTIFSFRKLHAHHILWGATGAFLFVFVFTPTVHATRTDLFRNANLIDKVALLVSQIKDRPLSGILTQTDQLVIYPYYPSYDSILIDRLEMIQDLDLVVAGMNSSNMLGYLPIKLAYQSSMPSFLVGSKPSYKDIDYIAYEIKLVPELRNLNRTFGIFGGAYSMFLFPDWIFIVLVVLISYFLFLRIVASRKLSNNIIGIYLLAEYAVLFSEKSVQGIVIYVIRTLPIDVLIILFFIVASRIGLWSTPRAKVKR